MKTIKKGYRLLERLEERYTKLGDGPEVRVKKARLEKKYSNLKKKLKKQEA